MIKGVDVIYRIHETIILSLTQNTRYTELWVQYEKLE